MISKLSHLVLYLENSSVFSYYKSLRQWIQRDSITDCFYGQGSGRESFGNNFRIPDFCWSQSF